MNTETYNRLLAQFAKLSAEHQAQSETMESDWLKGFYAGQATAYKSSRAITKIMNGEYEGTIMERKCYNSNPDTSQSDYTQTQTIENPTSAMEGF